MKQLKNFALTLFGCLVTASIVWGSGAISVSGNTGNNASYNIVNAVQMCFNGSVSNCFTEAGNIVTWGGNNGIKAQLFRTTTSTPISAEFAGINTVYAGNAAGLWQIMTNVSAANAGATGATAMTQVQPANALDSTDYVFSVNNNSAASLFSITHAGSITNRADNASWSVGTSATEFMHYTNSSGILELNNGGGLDIGATGAGTLRLSGKVTISDAAPTVTACSGGTAATMTASNGSNAFQLDVGTACAGESTVVLTFGAATTGWVCECSSTTADRVLQQKVMPNASTTVVTMQNIVISTGANGDLTDSADVACQCSGL